MEEEKIIESTTNDEYLVPIIGNYIKNTNISPIFKYKYPLFTAAGNKGRIYIFNNSLKHMGTFYGHQQGIWCLCAISNKILASGSKDKNIKIWNIENKVLISTLSEHRWGVTALCNMGERVFVSGSVDKSLIIWSKYELPGSSSTSTSIYSPKHVLKGHKTIIRGIIRINNREIISGECNGDLRIWDIVQGVCSRHILPSQGAYSLYQMKQQITGEVAVNYREKILVWGIANNWEYPIKEFSVCSGYSIEFLSIDILLRGGSDLGFIDYRGIGCSLPSPILGVHSKIINDIQRIAKNIVITVSDDGSIKVIDPMLRKCYLKFKEGGDMWMNAIVYLY